MTLLLKRFVLLGLVIVGALAANATPAQANISPASTVFTGTASDFVMGYSGTNISCSTASLTGATPSTGT